MLAHEKPIFEFEKTLQKLQEQKDGDAPWSDREIELVQKKLEALKNKVYSALTPWERVAICRHPQRPKTLDYIKNICENHQ